MIARGRPWMELQAHVEVLLAWVVLPAWLLAGLGDWACHRASGIERSSGTTESWLHLLLLAELGVPALLALFLEPNAFLFALLLGAWLVHQLTTWGELRFVTARREITPVEQQVHGFLQVLPLMAVLLLGLLHWEGFASLFAAGAAPQFVPRLRDEPLRAGTVLAFLGAALLLNWLPFLEELLRCRRAASVGAAAERAEAVDAE